MASAPNEKIKIVAEISSGELRADALDVNVSKEIYVKGNWVRTAPASAFENAVEQAIVTRAKVLYVQDKNKD